MSKNVFNSQEPRVAILMGSDSDLPVMQEAARALEKFEVSYDMRVLSAHRSPSDMLDFAKEAHSLGFSVLIAGAGGAAHLPGMLASATEIPVIGVPVPIGPLEGQDALLSIVQMPKGVPVATVAIGNAYNAGLLAVQILAAGGAQENEDLLNRYRNFKKEMRLQSLDKKV